MTAHFLVDLPGDPAELARQRLLMMSFLEDGEFARQVYAWVAGIFQPSFTAAFHAARAAGDVVESPVRAEDALWLSDYLCSMLATHCLPGRPVGPQTYCGADAVRTVACFLLRGIGLTDDALARHYPPDSRPAHGQPTADQSTARDLPDAPAARRTE